MKMYIFEQYCFYILERCTVFYYNLTLLMEKHDFCVVSNNRPTITDECMLSHHQQKWTCQWGLIIQLSLTHFHSCLFYVHFILWIQWLHLVSDAVVSSSYSCGANCDAYIVTVNSDPVRDVPSNILVLKQLFFNHIVTVLIKCDFSDGVDCVDNVFQK